MYNSTYFWQKAVKFQVSLVNHLKYYLREKCSKISYFISWVSCLTLKPFRVWTGSAVMIGCGGIVSGLCREGTKQSFLHMLTFASSIIVKIRIIYIGSFKCMSGTSTFKMIIDSKNEAHAAQCTMQLLIRRIASVSMSD